MFKKQEGFPFKTMSSVNVLSSKVKGVRGATG